MDINQFINSKCKNEPGLKPVFLAISILSRQCSSVTTDKFGFGYTTQLEQIRRDWIEDKKDKEINASYHEGKSIFCAPVNQPIAK